MVKRYNTTPKKVKDTMELMEDMGYTETPSPHGLESYCPYCEEFVMLVIKTGRISGECPKCNNATGNLTGDRESTGIDWRLTEE